MIATLKSGGEPAARRDYRMQLVAERLTGQPQDSLFVNDAMQWGIDTEPAARMAYEAATGIVVREVGLILPDDEDFMVAISPDGLIDSDGGCEIKCPKTATHLSWLEADEVPAEHIPQIELSLLVTGLRYWKFVSYDPRLPEGLQLFHKTYYRIDARLSDLDTKVRAFIAEVDEETERIRQIAAKRK
jgi:predicted phage-related endonuclease